MGRLTMILAYILIHCRIPFIKRGIRYLIRRVQSLYYGKIVVEEIEGVKYELDLSEMIESCLYFLGRYETDTSRVLHQYIKPDMIVFEVGANIGAHTFEIAKKLDPDKGKLFSFEPTEYAFKKLQRNFQLNRFNNIKLERVAFSGVNEVKQIHRATSPETAPFKASWDLKSGGPKHRSIDTIEFRRLDDYFAENNLATLDLLKIDVDGYELRVLRGGRKLLEDLSQ